VYSSVAHNLNHVSPGQINHGEACVDNSRVVMATVGGAVVGAIAGYLLFTEQGRSFRSQLEPALDDFSRELHSFRATIQRAAGVANEGWKLLNDTLGEAGQSGPRYSVGGQTNPF